MNTTKLKTVIIANANQTLDETLDSFKFYSDDPELLERNNDYYLSTFERMLPVVDGKRRELVDSINYVRRKHEVSGAINEHNSCSLNGVWLYNFLQQNNFKNTHLIDNIDMQKSDAKMLIEDADVVLISTTFITSTYTISRVGRVAKSWNPDVKVLVGGAKMIQFADEAELHNAAMACDGLILSVNGELTLLEILNRMQDGRCFHDVPNLAYYDNGFVRNPSEKDAADINETSINWLEIPDYILRDSANVRTGRGCPFKCKFCTFPSYNNQRVVLKSTDTIVNELIAIKQQPQIKSIRFVDDTLFISKKHLIKVCQEIIDLQLDIPWTAYLRTATITEETARYLSEAGCVLVLLGVEACDDSVLKNMTKMTTEAHNWTAANNLAKYGILAYSFILTGFPGETQRTINKTIDFLNNSGTQAYVHSPMFVFPNTPVIKAAKEFGLVGGFNDWRHDTMDARGAIDACEQIFNEVTNSAYIDRGSSICKVMIDHGYSAEEVRMAGIYHNEIARLQNAGSPYGGSYTGLEKLALKDIEIGSFNFNDEFTSYYSRVKQETQLDVRTEY